jgi:hypothetical protein
LPALQWCAPPPFRRDACLRPSQPLRIHAAMTPCHTLLAHTQAIEEEEEEGAGASPLAPTQLALSAEEEEAPAEAEAEVSEMMEVEVAAEVAAEVEAPPTNPFKRRGAVMRTPKRPAVRASPP